MISLVIPHIPLIGLQNPRKAYQKIVTFLPITRYSILLTWQCFFMEPHTGFCSVLKSTKEIPLSLSLYRQPPTDKESEKTEAQD